MIGHLICHIYDKKVLTSCFNYEIIVPYCDERVSDEKVNPPVANPVTNVLHQVCLHAVELWE